MGTDVEDSGMIPPFPRSAVEALESDGYIVLKGAAITGPILILADDELIPDVLGQITARWECRRREHVPASNPQVANPPIERSPQWKALASQREIIGVTYYHLGTRVVNWNWEYDAGGRGNATGKMNAVKAAGGGLIICNSWLARRLPIPSGEADLYLINFRRRDILGG
ncbi:hypothetical protein AJ80_02830 [Polytolypa hystricis UAMH7299]|uniref:Uncharacterized protein n=1 Tax=Polytolypa hystricis (strain UAMH7299) TaxID=1447883 RepID=A0A2B7YR00_POLH7|nr:hypothetical protein AJ80_02830 [Polytolypa hystricis UAMH7299]